MTGAQQQLVERAERSLRALDADEIAVTDTGADALADAEAFVAAVRPLVAPSDP